MSRLTYSPYLSNYYAMMDHFTRLRLPLTPIIDEKELTRQYFALQRQYHPDSYAGKPAMERQAALKEAMAINEAYNILKDPLKRAEYLLLLQGLQVNTETGGVAPSPTLLMEVMEQREHLAEARTVQAVAAIRAQALADKAQLFQLFVTHYNAGKLDAAAQDVIRLRYIWKLLEEVKITHASA